MNKQQKTAAVESITKRLDGASVVYLTDYSGLSVTQTNVLRGDFREAGVEYKVLKNTMIRLAMQGLGGYEDLYDYLKGPIAIATATDPSAPARVIKKFFKDNKIEKPAFRAALIEGALFDSLDTLAALKSKDELIGDIIGLLLAPMSNIIGAIQAPGANLVGAIKTIAEGDNA